MFFNEKHLTFFYLKDKVMWKHFETIYFTSFTTAVFNYKVVFDMIGKEKYQSQLKKLKEIIQQITYVSKLIVEEIKVNSQNIDLTNIFQIYCYTICIQYALLKMRIDILRSRDRIMDFKDPAPIYKGDVEDNTLRILNDIYRHCVEVDNSLFEVRKTLVKLNQPIPEQALTTMNKKICEYKSDTLKHRLWNMMRFFKSIGKKGQQIELDQCTTDITTDQSGGQYWAETIFTHRLRTTGKVTTKPSFTQKSIIIDNSDSPIVYKNTDINKDFNEQSRAKNNLKYILRESHNYNQHGLTHMYNVSVTDRSYALDILHKLDTQMTKNSKNEIAENKKGITVDNVKNPLKYFKRKTNTFKQKPIKILENKSSKNPKYTIWMKHYVDGTDCYWQVCDKAGLTEWDDLSDIPNYIGIAKQLKRSVVDGGFLFNKYLESWDQNNG